MPDEQRKSVLIGFDGLDAKLTSAMIQADLLPNLGLMAKRSGLRKVRSTTPAESAVAWASFACMAGPGDTGIFDFLGRRIGSYTPRLEGIDWVEEPVSPSITGRVAGAGVLGLGAAVSAWPLSGQVSRRRMLKGAASAGIGMAAATVAGLAGTQWYPSRVSKAHSTIQLPTWWDCLGELGTRCVILKMPMTFPAHAHSNVRLFSGLGTPDVHGTNGTYCVLADQTQGRLDNKTIPIRWNGSSAEVQLVGPRNPIKADEEATSTIKLERLADGAIRITTNRQEAVLKAGKWSEPIRLRFSFSPLAGVSAGLRAYLSPEPGHVQIYLTPVEFDAAKPPTDNPIASPSGLTKELGHAAGMLRTIGWETQTTGLNDGVLSEEAYLADAFASINQVVRLLRSQLAAGDWDVLMVVFQATDQIQHMFFDDAIAAARDGGPLPPNDHPLVRLYRRMDEIVGEALAAVETVEGCRLVVMSDHGMAPYRRSLNLNTWLAKRGWLALKDRGKWDSDSADAVLQGEIWSNVDWFNTRAYAVGLSGIYLNVAGREPHGIVKPEGEYEFMQERLVAHLREYKDPQTGGHPIAEVWGRQDLYAGKRVVEAPDLVLGLRPGYRVSSASAVGGIPPEEIIDNHSHWIGDHCGIHPDEVYGVCLTNTPVSWPEIVSIESLAITTFGLGR